MGQQSVSQDSTDESDLKKEDFKEDLELLDSKHHNDLPHDQSSRSSTVHKNIHGDGIIPFPLDGSSQHYPDRIFGTRHQESCELNISCLFFNFLYFLGSICLEVIKLYSQLNIL